MSLGAPLAIGDNDASERLVAAVTAATIRRLKAARRRLHNLGEVAASELLRDALGGLGASAFGGQIRGFLAAFEQGDRICRSARSARTERDIARLFEEVAATPHLLTAAPRQRPDAGFAARSERLGCRLVSEAIGELPLALALSARDGVPGQRFSLPRHESRELGCRAGERPIAGSGLLLRVPPGPDLTIELTARSMHVRRRRERLLTVARDAIAPTAHLVHRPEVAGSDHLYLARRLVSRGASLRVSTWVEDAPARLGDALAVVSAAWPQARDDIHRFTDTIVPLDEPGTVSYSLAARPGYSYINLWRKPLLQLADDLLHETAHHKLHAIEELSPLCSDEDDGAPSWWSPWRRAFRPLRGIAHACYTFTHAGLLFARVLETDTAGSAARRRYARRRLLEEEAMLAFSIPDLTTATAHGLLTPTAAELAQAISDTLASRVAPAAERALAALASGDSRDRRVVDGIWGLRRELGTMRREL